MIEPENIVEAFSRVIVLVVGDLMLDQYWWGTVDRISPEAPVPVVRLDSVSVNAGGAANVAANIAGLGAKVRIVGLVGRDRDGDLLLEELASAGIATQNVVRSERPTSVKTRVVAHSQHVVRVDREQSVSLDSDEQNEIADAVSLAMAGTDIVVLSDYAKGTLNNVTLQAAIDLAAEHKIPVLVDPKGKDFTKYRGASMLTPNRREALEACRIDDVESDAVKRAGEQLIGDLGLEALVITEGEQGMTLFERDRTPVSHRAAAHEIYDVTGAGDTVIACLAVAVAAGLPRREAVELANIAAGLVVEQVGTTAISIDALVEKLRSTETEHPLSGAALL
jgi:D-beta-D-heptose 7-phosphate kinase/D-beta-D-heptose 1-phosphate adenosyltransferase